MKACKVTIRGIDRDRDISAMAGGETLNIKLSNGKTICIECFERSHEEGMIAIRCDGQLVVYPEAINSIRVG